jgi:hypothetical protein
MVAQYLYLKNISENPAFYYEFRYICANCNQLFLGP